MQLCVDDRQHGLNVRERQHHAYVDERQQSLMTNLINSAIVGAMVRETREAAGLTQAQLADRIGASRFWLAAFESDCGRANRQSGAGRRKENRRTSQNQRVMCFHIVTQVSTTSPIDGCCSTHQQTLTSPSPSTATTAPPLHPSPWSPHLPLDWSRQ